jgi:selenocysteine lyase/cysteine desulfurase
MTTLIACRDGRADTDLEWMDERIAHVRALVARLIHASPDEIAFVGSTSHGLNIVAAGIDWRAGDNVVCAETEFPANVYPWLNLRRKGVEVRFARQDQGRIPLEAIATQMDDRTRLVAISLVEFFTGYRNNLAAIGDLCRQRGARLCVDGIQGLGVLPVAVRECGVDFLAAHGAKWLLGPIGSGFLYCRRERLLELDLAMAGWRSVVDQREYFRYESDWFDTARRFEVGSLNYLGLTGLGASLELLLEIGLASISERVLQLTERLIRLLRDHHYRVITPSRREERAGIVSFLPRDDDPEGTVARLKAADIVVSARGPGVRVSPHFYNTKEEIDTLMRVLTE